MSLQHLALTTPNLMLYGICMSMLASLAEDEYTDIIGF